MSRAASQRRSPGLSAVLQRAIVISAALATLLFALPLAAAVNGLYRNEAVSDLARDAERVRAEIGNALAAGQPVTTVVLPEARNQSTTLGVYAQSGQRIAGTGPLTAEPRVIHSARTGIDEAGVDSGLVLVAVPVESDNAVDRYVVRVAQPYSSIRSRTYLTWAGMAGLARWPWSWWPRSAGRAHAGSPGRCSRWPRRPTRWGRATSPCAPYRPGSPRWTP